MELTLNGNPGDGVTRDLQTGKVDQRLGPPHTIVVDVREGIRS